MARLTKEEAFAAIEVYNMARLGQYMSRALRRAGLSTPEQIGVSTQEDYNVLCEEIREAARRDIDANGANSDVHGQMAVAAEEVVEARAAARK